MIDSSNMSETEAFIRDLKSRINPETGEGFEYAEIGKILGISKQAAIQHIGSKEKCCHKCLRRLRRAPKFTNQTKP